MKINDQIWSQEAHILMWEYIDLTILFGGAEWIILNYDGHNLKWVRLHFTSKWMSVTMYRNTPP